MITSKFGIGQQVRHRLLGYLGVVVDIDAEYSLTVIPKSDELASNEALRHAPWYHVLMEDDEGQAMHTYLAEVQLDGEYCPTHPEQPNLDDLSESILSQYKAPQLRN